VVEGSVLWGTTPYQWQTSRPFKIKALCFFEIRVNGLPSDVVLYSRRTVIKKYIGLTRECVIDMVLIKGLATYLFIYLQVSLFLRWYGCVNNVGGSV